MFVLVFMRFYSNSFYISTLPLFIYNYGAGGVQISTQPAQYASLRTTILCQNAVANWFVISSVRWTFMYVLLIKKVTGKRKYYM